MIDITKDELLGGSLSDTPKWRERKKTRTKIKEFIKKNKVITIGVITFAICMVINAVFLYNFFRILSVL